MPLAEVSYWSEVPPLVPPVQSVGSHVPAPCRDVNEDAQMSAY